MLNDVYVLLGDRTESAINGFLRRFANEREESAEDYHLPQYSDQPTQVLKTAADVIRHCTKHPGERHSVYWRCLTTGGPEHAMVFFNGDGSVIAGLSVKDGQAENYLLALKAWSLSGHVLMLFESPPPDTAEAFRSSAEEQWQYWRSQGYSV